VHWWPREQLQHTSFRGSWTHKRARGQLSCILCEQDRDLRHLRRLAYFAGQLPQPTEKAFGLNKFITSMLDVRVFLSHMRRGWQGIGYLLVDARANWLGYGWLHVQGVGRSQVNLIHLRHNNWLARLSHHSRRFYSRRLDRASEWMSSIAHRWGFEVTCPRKIVVRCISLVVGIHALSIVLRVIG